MQYLASIACVSAVLAVSAHDSHADIRGRASTPISFYVALNGNDSNPGTSPAQPFATLQGAQIAVAALKSVPGGMLPADVVVNIAPGTYYQTSRVVVTTADGGDGVHSVTWVAPSGGVVLSSAAMMSGWAQTAWDPTLFTWSPNAGGQLSGGVFPPSVVRTLFGPDGVRRSWCGVTDTYTDITTDANHMVQIVLPPGQLQADASMLADANVYVYHSWTSSISRVGGFDASNSTLFLSDPLFDTYNTASLNRYRLVNVAGGAFTQKGGFYYVSANQTVVYRALDGEDPRSQTFLMPVTGAVLSIMGFSRTVQNVSFINITFAHTDPALESTCLYGGCDGQSASDQQFAAVEVTNATSILFSQCEVTGTGQYGMWVHAGCTNVTISACSLHDLGAGGVRIGEAISGTAPAPGLLTTGITLTDSEIFDTGHIVEAGAGVLLQQAAHCNVVHNHIHDLYYTGISTGWTWGYAQTSNGNLNVSYNHIHDIFRGVLSDGGCIYNLGISPGTVFDHNLCHDVVSAGYGGWGLYTDEGSSSTTWSNNIVYNTKSGGIHQHYGLGNMFINNVIAFPDIVSCDNAPNCDNAAVRSSQHPPGSGPGAFSSFSFLRNIVLLRNASASLFFTTIPTAMQNMTVNNNVYWSEVAVKTTLTFPPSQAPTTFAQWQAQGKDTNSVVQDPQFVNADGLDFSDLQPTSPALKLGFQPIDTSQIGPRVVPGVPA